MPVLPIVLVNGASGIGSGWSTQIPRYNPRDVSDNVMRLLRGERIREMKPWYRDFRGDIRKMETEGSSPCYTITGKYKKIDGTSLLITELPVGTRANKYLRFLEKMKKKGFIESYENQSDDRASVRIRITITEERMKLLVEDKDVEKKFNLAKPISLNNMHLLHRRVIRKYETAEKGKEAAMVADIEEKMKKVDSLSRHTKYSLWSTDLIDFMNELQIFYPEERRGEVVHAETSRKRDFKEDIEQPDNKLRKH